MMTVAPTRQYTAAPCTTDELALPGFSLPHHRASSHRPHHLPQHVPSASSTCRRLQRRLLEFVARDQHGAEGVRILRLLLNTGKMDEKRVRQSPRCPPRLLTAYSDR